MPKQQPAAQPAEHARAAQHWDAAYSHGDHTRSWYQDQATTSRDLITGLLTDPSAPVVDVGGGASTLADGLLDWGCTDLSVVDVSADGMALAQARLGARASAVKWLLADLRTWLPSRPYRVWHDRAVLHFMTSDADLAGYRSALLAGTAPGSFVVVAAFAADGPTSCSGLPVRRYDAADLADFLGIQFAVRSEFGSEHVTPSGSVQPFQWVVAERVTEG